MARRDGWDGATITKHPVYLILNNRKKKIRPVYLFFGPSRTIQLRDGSAGFLSALPAARNLEGEDANAFFGISQWV